MYKLLLVILFNIILSGCTSVPQYGEVFSSDLVSQVPKDKARLVIYKKGVNAVNGYAGAFVEILIDDKETGKLSEGSFIIRDVTPGAYNVTATTPLMSRPAHAMMLFKDRNIEKTFKADSVYYINYHIIAKPIVHGSAFEGGIVNPTSYQEFDDIKFIEQPANKALEQLKSCRLLKGFEPLNWNKEY